MKPWSRAVTKILSFSEDRGARIVGITGDAPGVGVSLLSREVAHAYSRFGINVVLVDASRVDMSQIGLAEGHNAPFDLAGSAQKDEADLSIVDLAAHAHFLPKNPAHMRQLFEAAAADDTAVVVDLPPLQGGEVQDPQLIGLIGAACTLVYLVCLSGVITKAKLSDCVEMCKINRVPMGGLIVNDWRQPGAWLVPGG